MFKNLRGSTVLYVLDLICMISALSLVGFSLYIAPYLLLNYTTYDVPAFVVQAYSWYLTNQTSSGFLSKLVLFVPLIAAAVAFIFIAELIAHYVETHGVEPGVPHIDKSDYEEHRQRVGEVPKRHPWYPTIIVVSLISLVIITVVLLEYFLVIGIFV